MAYTAKYPRPPTAFSVPNRNVLYLRETKLWRCERRRGGGGGENVHLLTHAPARGVGKNRDGDYCDNPTESLNILLEKFFPGHMPHYLKRKSEVETMLEWTGLQ